MRINLETVYQWSDRQQRYIRIRQKSIIWTGPTEFAKGASAAQNNLANSQASFATALQQDYGTQFAQQSNILSSLNNSLSPIIQAGPNQFGFSAGETNNLNSSAIQNTGQQYNNASKALKANQAAEGGGNASLPSGVASTQQANLAASAANTASDQLLGVQNAGYQQGHQQYESAIGQLGSVASQYNPTSYAGSANNAGSSAFNSATTVQQANQAASPMGIISPILGGLASGFGNALTGGLSGALGGIFSGGAKGLSETDPQSYYNTMGTQAPQLTGPQFTSPGQEPGGYIDTSGLGG